MKHVHLICNAHLDPVWLWPWEEGAAEALSTFRIAADFCDEYGGYVFNHNEAVLYEWIEEYDNQLFERIQRLVRSGQWHIMGGWYLQPDCNMPSGESFVRQILYGRRYFADRFGSRPTTAINFDPFGHSRGLVQILAKSGFDSYIFGRPMGKDLPLPEEEFEWVGFDGSRVIGHRSFGHYLSQKGRAAEKIEKFLAEGPEQDTGLLLWGIGNHGGGASREDLDAIRELSRRLVDKGVHLIHSTPEAYFAERESDAPSRPEFREALNPWAPGCYTSQIRIKQKHRRLEDELLLVEKTAVQAVMRGRMPYPRIELREALKDLMFVQFHDILPGSSIPRAEEAALDRLGHGLEIVSRVKNRALIDLSAGEPAPEDGVIPILGYNPHPFAVEGTFEVEFQPSHQNWAGTFMSYDVHQAGAGAVPVQFEKEASSVGVDWRKRMVMRATLAPGSLVRFDCTPVEIPEKPRPTAAPDHDGRIRLAMERYSVVVGATGLIESWRVDGKETLQEAGLVARVLRDSDDAWESRGRAFRDVAGSFRSATPGETADLCGVPVPELAPVRVIEQGPVRTVVEAVFVWNRSELVMTYEFPVHGTEIGVHVRVFWNEKRSMLKLGLPLCVAHPADAAAVQFIGQTAYGVQPLVTDGEEAVAQRWVAVSAADATHAVSVINNGTYGCSIEGDELRLTLLRSPAYSALPAMTDAPPVPDDRFVQRMDQGEREFRFWLNAGPAAERLAAIDREATAHAERPGLLMLYPSPVTGDEAPHSSSRVPAITLSDDVVQLAALKEAEDGAGLIVRLFEPTGLGRTTVLSLPVLGVEQEVTLAAFEIVSFRVEPDRAVPGRATVTLVDLVEEEA
jgi:alpha-mannosidase